MSKENEKNCCGSCCWFYGELTDGWGQCMRQDICDSMHCSDLCTTYKYISKEKLRHSAAVLAQYRRFQRALTLDRGNSISGVLVPFDGDKISEAIEIITRYVNVITKKV